MTKDLVLYVVVLEVMRTFKRWSLGGAERMRGQSFGAECCENVFRI